MSGSVFNAFSSLLSINVGAYRAAYNTILSLKGQDWVVDTLEKLPEGVQPQISVEELLLCEEIIRADERVIKFAADVGGYNVISRHIATSIQSPNRRQARATPR